MVVGNRDTDQVAGNPYNLAKNCYYYQFCSSLYWTGVRVFYSDLDVSPENLSVGFFYPLGQGFHRH